LFSGEDFVWYRQSTRMKGRHSTEKGLSSKRGLNEKEQRQPTLRENMTVLPRGDLKPNFQGKGSKSKRGRCVAKEGGPKSKKKKKNARERRGAK